MARHCAPPTIRSWACCVHSCIVMYIHAKTRNINIYRICKTRIHGLMQHMNIHSFIRERSQHVGVPDGLSSNTMCFLRPNQQSDLPSHFHGNWRPIKDWRCGKNAQRLQRCRRMWRSAVPFGGAQTSWNLTLQDRPTLVVQRHVVNKGIYRINVGDIVYLMTNTSHKLLSTPVLNDSRLSKTW